MDQAVFLAYAAAGHHAVIQLLWQYGSAVDVDGLQRFRANLEHGLLARLVQPAVLPMGRHRWVRVAPTHATLLVDAPPIPPQALRAWADAQVELPLDPALGPGWRLTVQPLTDGATAVSLVVSHCLSDGTATMLAVCDAVEGRRIALPFSAPTPGRYAARALGELRQGARDLPAALRALPPLAGAAWRAMSRRMPKSRRAADGAPPAMEPVHTVALPSVSFRTEAAVLKAAARRRGVHRLTLLAALSAHFAVRLGRVHDGTVTLLIPVNLREGRSDLGANRVALATVTVRVETLYEPLGALQETLNDAVAQAKHGAVHAAALLPLVPFIPRRLVATLGDLAFNAPTDRPVTCSHMGALPDAAVRIDGSAAAWVGFRGVDRQVSAGNLARRGGVATLLSGVLRDQLLLNFIAYEPGRVTEAEQLRQLVVELLVDVDLPDAVMYA
jgi:hypothetical protein